MAVDQKATTTLMWLKQLTTNVFPGSKAQSDRAGKMRPPKKTLLFLVLLWCVVVALGLTGLHISTQNRLDGFLKSESEVIHRLAEQTSAPLLEDDALRLIRIVTEFEKEPEVAFVAILNHENKIVAHSDPEMLNLAYEGLNNEAWLADLDNVLVSTGQSTQGDELIAFSRNITFSDVKIGSVLFSVFAETYLDINRQNRLYQVVLICLSAIVIAGGAIVRAKYKTSPPTALAPMQLDQSRIGPYHLKDKIAQGGMAELFLADYQRSDGFRRTVVVKKVLPHLTENQDFINMFIREARLAALLQHPNIVQLFDFGKIQNTYFIAMEFIDGKTLGQVMARLQKGLPVDLVVFLIMNLCLGLDYSHKRRDDETGTPLGLVHRDVSPQNIMVSYQGEVKISDFGISKANTEPSLTQAGVIKGKLAYLSPEQAVGEIVDHQADIYALGLVFYEILTATRIYRFDSDIEAINTIPKMEISPVHKVREDIPASLSAIVMKCLAKDKTQRYQDAKEIHDDLFELKTTLNLSFDASDLSTFLKTTFNHD
jgi:tRNA A-37 threonylcarbamoyl transferase component Bud32